MARAGRSGGGGGGRSFGGGGAGRGFSGGAGSFGGRAGRSSGGSSGGFRAPGGFGGPRPGGFGGPRMPRAPRHHMPLWGWGWFGPRRQTVIIDNRGGGGGGPTGGGRGCGTVLSIALVALVVLVIVALIVGSISSDAQVVRSTVAREPLPAGSAIETGYYTDELGWIHSETTLTAGMRNFYKKTGIQPYLYLLDNVDGAAAPANPQVEAFAQRTYDSLFQDEAHLLLIFLERDGQYFRWVYTGTQANALMDAEAMDILYGYIDQLYYSDLSEEEYFSRVFNDTGERIMQVTTSPWIPVLITLGAIVILVLLIAWWASAKRKKAQEAERTERILNTPLSSFGDTEAEQRAKKYEEDDG